MTRITTETTPAADNADPALRERVRAATELLESIAADRLLLDRLPADDRERLHDRERMCDVKVSRQGVTAREVELQLCGIFPCLLRTCLQCR